MFSGMYNKTWTWVKNAKTYMWDDGLPWDRDVDESDKKEKKEENKKEAVKEDVELDEKDIIMAKPTVWGKSKTLEHLWTVGGMLQDPGTKVSGPRRLEEPRDICILPSGKVAVTDPTSKCIRILSMKDGAPMHTILSGMTTSDLVASGVTATRSGYILFTDTSVKRVRIYDFEKPYMKKVEWSHTFGNPVSVARLNSEHYIVIDDEECTVNIVSNHGKRLRSFGAQHLQEPTYVSADNLGRIYVVDEHTHSVVVFNQYGQHLYTFGGRGSSENLLNTPKGIFVDKKCNIYVCDHYNDRISVFSPDGRIKFHIRADGLQKPIGLDIDMEKGLVAVTYKYMSWTNVSLYKLC